MRYPIKISSAWQPMFAIFGFSANSSYVEVDDGELTLCFGTAKETVPLENVANVVQRRWPLFFGLGPKLGPDGGVAYVGSTDGVLQIWFKEPIAMNVWGPFRHSKAKCVTISLHDPAGFKRALEEKLGR